MKKLKLQLEDLEVDGFSTTPAEPERGTVNGHSHFTWCTCPGGFTCDATCPNTCAATCPNTCPQTCDDFTCAYESCGGTCFQSRCVDTCLCN